MRRPLYDLQARRKTISISLNADLAEKARAAGINISRTAEAALATAFIAHERAAIRAEIEAAAALVDAYIAEHGPPFLDWANADEAPGGNGGADLADDAA